MKKYICIFLSIIIISSLTACNNSKESSTEIEKENTNEVVENVEENNDEKSEDNSIKQEEQQEEQNEETTAKKFSQESNNDEIELYFANQKYIETGDETLEKLMPEKRIIEHNDISIEEAIVKELIKEPENTELCTAIPSSIKLIDVKVSDKTALVNFAKEGLSGGSLEEKFTLNQIIKSLVGLDNIEKVQFLVDGEKAETLMGHYEIFEPFENIVE